MIADVRSIGQSVVRSFGRSVVRSFVRSISRSFRQLNVRLFVHSGKLDSDSRQPKPCLKLTRLQVSFNIRLRALSRYRN